MFLNRLHSPCFTNTSSGGPVEIGSGVSALAYSMVLGKRQQRMMLNFRPHNVSLVTLGTVLLWFGWLGFNGGSAFGANLRAVMACWNTSLTAAFASITWVLLDFRLSRKWSMVGWVCLYLCLFHSHYSRADISSHVSAQA